MTSPTRTYTVTGMTCGHCVASVTEEISEIHGVTGVDVDLASGSTAVSGEGFNDDDVRAAVREAGYEVVPADAGSASSLREHRDGDPR